MHTERIIKELEIYLTAQHQVLESENEGIQDYFNQLFTNIIKEFKSTSHVNVTEEFYMLLQYIEGAEAVPKVFYIDSDEIFLEFKSSIWSMLRDSSEYLGQDTFQTAYKVIADSDKFTSSDIKSNIICWLFSLYISQTNEDFSDYLIDICGD